MCIHVYVCIHTVTYIHTTQVDSTEHRELFREEKYVIL